jgi:hypothetical protein
VIYFLFVYYVNFFNIIFMALYAMYVQTQIVFSHGLPTQKRLNLILYIYKAQYYLSEALCDKIFN